MKRLLIVGVSALTALASAPTVLAFCGFYVAKADTKLFNQASQVVLARHEDKTVLTMANDFKGDPKEFAIVVPVPTLLEKGQIHVGERAVIEHLDAYTAPRLVEYFDENPCRPRMLMAPRASAPMRSTARDEEARAKSLGVTIEARYTVGEYDILILSARESSGLETWLRDNGYRIPTGATAILGSYIKQNMKFFVAKVNLQEQSKLGFTYLRPLQVAYESPKFMLPIRLGTVNADGPQELFVYALTRRGRVETTNYRTVRLPSDAQIPLFVRDEFPRFYRDMFTQQVKKEDMRAVFLEYAWDMNWCDPCAADPLTREELPQLGVFWVDVAPAGPSIPGSRGRRFAPSGAVDVFVTRLHVRYDAAHFPEDLVFQETADRTTFQGRYILRHPWKGAEACEAAKRYGEELRSRADREAQTLAALTSWPIEEIRTKMRADYGDLPGEPLPWWRRLWGG
ncbi:MAG: DUF2330 domain-containing protein [Candidatus Rokuibacteriota bacterium]|nr:MAG: DUF2330 domain-containing protein [Candidatus Rokubacteria bacterium]